MARVAGFVERPSTSAPHPTEVVCHYQVVDNGTRRFLQLTTLGSKFRQTRPKNSQTLQFDARQAAELLKIIYRSFPELRDGER